MWSTDRKSLLATSYIIAKKIALGIDWDIVLQGKLQSGIGKLNSSNNVNYLVVFWLA